MASKPGWQWTHWNSMTTRPKQWSYCLVESLGLSLPHSQTLWLQVLHVSIWFTLSVTSVHWSSKKTQTVYLFLSYDYLSWPYFRLHLQQTHAVKSESIRSVAFAKSTWKIVQSTLQMVSPQACHSVISTVILVKYLTSVRLCVSIRFASQGLTLGAALSTINSMSRSVNLGNHHNIESVSQTKQTLCSFCSWFPTPFKRIRWPFQKQNPSIQNRFLRHTEDCRLSNPIICTLFLS